VAAADALERFRIGFAGRPLLLWFAALAVLWLLSRQSPASMGTSLQRTLTACSIAGLAAYLMVAIWYGLDPHFFDNAEPTIPAIGWLFSLGKPIYHDVSSPERYSHVYGPVTFMLQGVALRFFGASIVTAKFVGVSAGILSLVAFFGAVRKMVGARSAVVATGVTATALLTFRHLSFWTRPDPLQLLAACTLLLVVSRSTGTLGAMAIGVLTAILWNLKITGPCYALPAFCILFVTGGWRRVIIAAVVGVACGAAPFVLFANVSWTNYVTWIRLSAHTGLLFLLLRQNIEWALFLSLPLVVAIATRRSSMLLDDRFALLGLLVGACAVIVLAAKPGAGPYHLIPFIPAVAYMTLRLYEPRADFLAKETPAAVAFVVVLLLVAVANQFQLVRTIRDRGAIAETEDVLRFARARRGDIQMGYGETEAMSFARPLLVFRSGSYLIDQPAIREHQLAGIDVPVGLVRELAACQVPYWLIPRGERPFAGTNSYTAVRGRPLYPIEFVDAFRRSYHRAESTTYFDVWECSAATTMGR
jgi:hypothetical protein